MAIEIETNRGRVSSPRTRSLALLACLLVGVGVGRIVLTYRHFFQTSDEPCHVASGMAWLDGDPSDLDHPPLARVLIALGPYADGLRISDLKGLPAVTSTDRCVQGNAILRLRHTYLRNLTLARMGILPFYVAACWLVWAWTRRLFGAGAALAAVFLFSGLPPVLAHSGLATTDMAFATTFFGALYAFHLWLENSSRRRAIVLGLAIGSCALSKFSAFLFLPACAGALLLARALVRSRTQRDRPRRSVVLRQVVLAGLMASLAIWAGYRFGASRLVKPEARPHARAARYVGGEKFLERHSALQNAFFTAAEMPVPAADLVRGLSRIRSYNARGRLEYFLGEFRTDGWWYFFPVLLGVKTPLAFLLLVGVGAVLLRRSPQRGSWEAWAPLICVCAILIVCLPSRLNLGLRHVLAVYPFLAMLAGYALSRLSNAGRGLRIAAAALALWFVVASVRAHPDYLADFNELAGGRPDRIAIDSDLDWGQDLWRLRDKLRELGVSDVALAYYWTDQLEGSGLPNVRTLVPYEPTTGWIAISEFTLRTQGELLRRELQRATGAYGWLEAYPYTRIGKSIRLYSIRP
jgi:hypothetical protein